MKNPSSLITLLLGVSLMVSNLTARSQTRINFNGLWKTSEDVLVNIKDSGSSIIAKYLNPGDCPTGHLCVIGGGAEYYLKGTVSSTNKMTLTMLRCTHDSDMRKELSPRWTTPCKVTTVNNKSISGTANIEWYNWDIVNGRKVNFKRNASSDYDAPFGLTRTNCKEELEKLVAELDLKGEIKNELNEAIQDADSSFFAAKQDWFDEVKDQLKEEAFHKVVPPAVKILPETYNQDPGSYIESWLDFVTELAQKGGNFALEKAGKTVLIWDMLIDWTNVFAKGFVTLDEMDQINSGRADMNDRTRDNALARYRQKIEYDNLSKLCAGEIPLDQQPKPKDNAPLDNNFMENQERLHKAMDNAYKNTGSAIQSAITDLRKTADAVESLKQFLEPFRNADPNKTMKEVMTAAGISTLQNGLIDAGKNWINVFRQIEIIEENRKKLSELSKPGIG